MRRGDVCWADLSPRSGAEQTGRRPVVVVSHDAFNEVSGWRSVIVVPLTTSERQGLRGPTVARVSPSTSGLPKLSFALCHQITTLDRGKLNPPSGRLGPLEMRSIEQGILAACGIGTAE